MPDFVKVKPNLDIFLGILALSLFTFGTGILLQKAFSESRKFFKGKSFYFSSESVFLIAFLAMLFIMSFYLLIGWDRYLVHLIFPAWLIIILALIFGRSILLTKTKRDGFTKVNLGHLKEF